MSTVDDTNIPAHNTQEEDPFEEAICTRNYKLIRKHLRAGAQPNSISFFPNDWRTIKILRNHGLRILDLDIRLKSESPRRRGIYGDLFGVNQVSCVIEDGAGAVREHMRLIKRALQLGVVFGLDDWRTIRTDYDEPTRYLTPSFDRDHPHFERSLVQLQKIFLFVWRHFTKRGIQVTTEESRELFDIEPVREMFMIKDAYLKG